MTWPLRNKPAVSHTSLPRLPSRAIIHFWLSFFPPPPFPRASVTASGRFPASGYAQAWSGRRVCSWQQQREETYIFVRYLYVTVLCHYRNEEETENPTGVGLLLLLLLTTTTPTTTTATAAAAASTTTTTIHHYYSSSYCCCCCCYCCCCYYYYYYSPLLLLLLLLSLWYCAISGSSSERFTTAMHYPFQNDTIYNVRLKKRSH